MDWPIFWTIVGAFIAGLGLVYMFIRNFKTDLITRFDRFEDRIDLQEERIFQLATGKTLKEAMLEAKKNQDEG